MRKLKFKNEHIRIRARARTEQGAALLARLSEQLEAADRAPRRGSGGRFMPSSEKSSPSAATDPTDDKGSDDS